MIIDAHTHLFSEEVQKNRSSFCRRDEGFRVLYENEKARLASVEELLRTMDRDGVQQSVICGFPGKIQFSAGRAMTSFFNVGASILVV